jgi:hypothetical protein
MKKYLILAASLGLMPISRSQVPANGGGALGAAADEVSRTAERTSQGQLNTARKRAIEALRRGDTAAADSAIAEAIIARGDDGGTGANTAEELTSLSFSLSDLGDKAIARKLATGAALALEPLERGQDRKVSLRAGLLAAHLQERILQNPVKAREAYQRVLVADPANFAAKEGLARIDLINAVVAERVKEQQLLQRQKSQAN